MIAKQIHKKDSVKSNIARLVKYCEDAQGKTSRVGETWCVNCGTDDPEVAAKVMEMTQLMNTRAKGDKTYHLMISFRAGEAPDREQMEEIEREMCEALGYGAHQRVAVVHKDTDNWHIHVAINRVNPVTHRKLDPRNDYDILANKCRELERRFFLERDRHKGDPERPRTEGEAHIDDMRRQNGVEPLADWVKRECLDGLKAAKTWDEFLKVCARNGLEYKTRGNGAVFVAGETAVKASTVDRELAKAKLEKRFGGPLPERNGPEAEEGPKERPEKRYEGKPKERDAATDRLYSRYLMERDAGLDERKDLLRAARKMRYRAAQERYRAAMILSRALFGGAKKEAMARAEERKKAEFAAIREEMGEAMRKVRRKGWVEWLKDQAEQGDLDALKLLRRRAYGMAVKNALGGGAGQGGWGIDADAVADGKAMLDTVTKKGTVLYNVGGEIVRDNGDGFYCYGQTRQDTLVMMLQMTAKRFGSVIDVTGNEEFRRRCVEAAVAGGLKVTFKDEALERARLEAVRAGRVYLDVPLAQKDRAKAAGARWDAEEKRWYVPEARKTAPAIQEWLPTAKRPGTGETTKTTKTTTRQGGRGR